jgi:hypothetical protein
LIALYLPIALSPCLIPTRNPLPRALAAVNAVVVAVKLFDVCHDVQRGTPSGWRQFVTFLLNPFLLVRRCLPAEPRPSVRSDLLSAAGGALGLAAGITLLRAMFRTDWGGRPFLAEHVVKVAAFFLVVFSGLALAAASWRLLGGPARAVQRSSGSAGGFGLRLPWGMCGVLSLLVTPGAASSTPPAPVPPLLC